MTIMFNTAEAHILTCMKRMLNEATVTKIYKTLLEKFGEPIGKAADLGPGVADERGGHSHRGKGKEPENNGWGADFEHSNPVSVNEAASVICDECGAMLPMEGGECHKCGMIPGSMPIANVNEDDEMNQAKLGITSSGTWGIDMGKRDRCEDCDKPLSPEEAKNPYRVCDDCMINVEPERRDLNMYRGSFHEAGAGGRHPGHASSCTCPDCSRPKDDKNGELLHDEVGITEDDLTQKAPPGKKGERTVKALKKAKGVKNPWAVAWAMRNRGQI